VHVLGDCRGCRRAAAVRGHDHSAPARDDAAVRFADARGAGGGVAERSRTMRWRLAKKLLNKAHTPPCGPQGCKRLRHRAARLPRRQRQRWRDGRNRLRSWAKTRTRITWRRGTAFVTLT
jgi:hypothetical protein